MYWISYQLIKSLELNLSYFDWDILTSWWHNQLNSHIIFICTSLILFPFFYAIGSNRLNP